MVQMSIRNALLGSIGTILVALSITTQIREVQTIRGNLSHKQLLHQLQSHERRELLALLRKEAIDGIITSSSSSIDGDGSTNSSTADTTDGEWKQHEVVSVLFSEVNRLIQAASPNDDGDATKTSSSCQEKTESLEREIQSLKQKVLEALEQPSSSPPSSTTTSDTETTKCPVCPEVPEPKACPVCPTNTVKDKEVKAEESCPPAPPCPTCPKCTKGSSTISRSSLQQPQPSVLQVAWQEMANRYTSESDREKFRVLTNVHVRTHDAKEDEVTLLTHISANQMERIVTLEKYWGGPVSVAVWVKSVEDIALFYQFIQQQAKYNPTMTEHASFHILMEYHANKMYPHNRLRNIAAKYSDTDYFLNNDADIVTKPNTFRELMQLIRAEPGAPATKLDFKSQLDKRSLFVIPVFERFMPKGFRGEIVTEDLLPQTKEDVLKMKDQGVSPFYLKRGSNLAKIQGPTDFPKWYGNETDIYYPIEYAADFEPYTLGSKYGAPQYWEGFRGFGWNKQSWFYEAGGRMKYKMFTMRDFFMVHRNHAGKRAMRKEINKNAKHWAAFSRYLNNHYGETHL